MEDSVLRADDYDDATTVLTLNRPARRNALTIGLMRSFVEQLESLSQSADRRIVIVRGAGPVFCAGLDLIEAAEMEVAHRSAEWVARLFQTIVECPLVTIAAAHGAAMAGGAGIMTACDFVVASSDLRIGFPEVRRGLVPALVSTLLKNRLRDSELRELLLMAEPVGAARALEIGLVHRLVPPEEVMPQALKIAQTVRLGAPQAIRMTKQLLRESPCAEPDKAFQRALDNHKQARKSEEAQEGLAAFRQRRDPDWNRCK